MASDNLVPMPMDAVARQRLRIEVPPRGFWQRWAHLQADAAEVAVPSAAEPTNDGSRSSANALASDLTESAKHITHRNIEADAADTRPERETPDVPDMTLPPPLPAFEPLPVAANTASTPADTAADDYEDDELDEPATPDPSRYRVLIVEDDRSQSLFAQSIMRAIGIDAHVANSADTVMDALARLDIELILMDLHLTGGTSGLDLTREIRKHPEYLNLPIVFLSGDPTPEREYEALEAGADDYLDKPIKPRHLVAALADRLRRSRLGRNLQTSVNAASTTGRFAAAADTPAAAPLAAQLINATLGDAAVELAFQPIASVRGPGNPQYQVLMRLRRHDGSLVPAAQAVPAAELAGRIVELDRQVISHTLKLLARQQKQGGAPLRLFVSQSPRSIAIAGAADALMKMIDAHGVDPASLIIDLRLNDALTHTATLRNYCQRLATIGMQFSLSQYEASDTAQALLRRLPLSYLRLTGRYANANRDPALIRELREVIHVARQHGLQVIGQQVEDTAQAAILRDCGVDLLQGNHVQKVGIDLRFDFSNAVN